MMLEAVAHHTASFVTLTYAEMPTDGSLHPAHLKDFLKRLRANLEYAGKPGIRYYAVGEYGDISFRPHYHLALFGCDEKAEVEKAWQKGIVDVGSLTMESAQYVAGYVTKKMSRFDDPRLQGKYPEFARMSLRPGIGAVSITQVADALRNKFGWDSIVDTGDVPNVLKHGRRNLPLGRYMRRKLREALDFQNLGQSEESAYNASAEMLVVYQNYIIEQEAKGNKSYTLSSALAEIGAQRRLQIEQRVKRLSLQKGVGI